MASAPPPSAPLFRNLRLEPNELRLSWDGEVTSGSRQVHCQKGANSPERVSGRGPPASQQRPAANHPRVHQLSVKVQPRPTTVHHLCHDTPVGLLSLKAGPRPRRPRDTASTAGLLRCRCVT